MRFILTALLMLPLITQTTDIRLQGTIPCEIGDADEIQALKAEIKSGSARCR